MRNSLSFIFTLAVFSTLIYSCGGNQFVDKIQTLDSLSVEVERLIDSIQVTDTSAYRFAHKTIEKNITLIQNELKDTVTQEEASFLSDYKMIRKSLGNYTDKIKALYQELIYTKKQLKSLSRDLQRGYIEASKADEYFSIEVTSAQAVLEDGWSTLNNSPVYLKMFEELHPKVQEFINKHQLNEKE